MLKLYRILLTILLLKGNLLQKGGESEKGLDNFRLLGSGLTTETASSEDEDSKTDIDSISQGMKLDPVSQGITGTKLIRIPLRRKTTVITFAPMKNLLSELPSTDYSSKKDSQIPYEDFNQILTAANECLSDEKPESMNIQENMRPQGPISLETDGSFNGIISDLEDKMIAKHMNKSGQRSTSEMVDSIQSKLNSFDDTIRNVINSQSLGDESAFDIHSIKTLHSSGFKSRMFDLVKNVNSYTDFNLLMAAQLILPRTDSKDFVDRPTKRPIKAIRRDFNRLRKRLGIENYSKVLSTDKNHKKDFFEESFTVNSNPFGSLITSAAAEIAAVATKTKIEMLKRFIDDNFELPGTDLKAYKPDDWKSHPEILKENDALGNKITNKNVKEIVIALNNVWKELSRVKVEKEGSSSTLLSLPYPFMVPGGRFREFYYWDTYFILEGLVRSKMYESAFNIVRNFAHIIKTLGYIPNGTREYYKFRSQPPFFPLMLIKIMGINEEMDQFVLTEGLKMALREYNWFKKYRSVQVKKGNKIHLLNFFHVKTDFPRPESLSEDIKTFLSQNLQSEGQIFSNLKSGAESGWDFSRRWFKGDGIETIAAYNQIPVDLNAILYKNEQIISKLLEKNAMTQTAKEFGDLASKRYEAINAILWNDKIGTWNDVRLDDNSFVDQRFFFSNLFPLIFDITPPSKSSLLKKHQKSKMLNENTDEQEKSTSSTENTIYSVLNVHKKELFFYKGGVPASGEGPSDQQWDFPNVWAPHQYLIVEKLYSLGEKQSALQIARAFYNSVKAGYLQSKVFYEKYNCLKLGLTGKGGEYEAQTGFGWTNGTALSFIHMFGDLLDEEYDVQNEYEKIIEYLAIKVSQNVEEESF